MIHYILVKVETGDETKPMTLVNEILSNLESVVNEEGYDITGNIRVMNVPKLGDDLKTLFVSSQNATEAIECAAALGNFTSDLMLVFGIPEPVEGVDFDPSRSTNLNRFNLAKKEKGGC